MILNLKLAKHFQGRCKSRDWDQKKVRQKTGWPQPMVSDLQTGNRLWTLERISTAAKIFGQRPFEFLAEAQGYVIKDFEKAK